MKKLPRIPGSPKLALCPAILTKAGLIRLWVARWQHSWDPDEGGGAHQLRSCGSGRQGSNIWSPAAGCQAFPAFQRCHSREATQPDFARCQGKNASLVGGRLGLPSLPTPPGFL